MKHLAYPFLLIVALFSCIGSAFCQQANSYFSERSAVAYKERIAALKASTAPQKYKDKKQQTTYADLVKSANEYAYKTLEANEIIYDTLLLKKCGSIIKKLKAANKGFAFDSVTVYINRSPIANAMNVGQSGTMFINLGLFLWLDNDDELAIVIGHEYAHYFLQHMDQALEKNMAILASDDFKDELKSIKNSKDGKYQRLKSLIKDFTVQTGKHSRYKESEADSLSAVFLRNAGYNVNKAAIGLLKLDKVQDIYTKDSLYAVKQLYEHAVLDPTTLAETKKYNGLSAVKVTMNADKMIDSVKTHPDCVSRYKELTTASTAPAINCCTTITPEYRDIKERALQEIIRNLYETNELTLCIHFCHLAEQNGFTDPMYHYFIAASMFQIYGADKRLERFTYTNANADAGSNLKKLQDFIFKCNAENIASIGAYYLNHGKEIAGEDYYFAQLVQDINMGKIEKAVAAVKLKNKFPKSKYLYLLAEEKLK